MERKASSANIGKKDGAKGAGKKASGASKNVVGAGMGAIKKAISFAAGEKAASASAAQKIAGADASNKAGAAGAEKKPAVANAEKKSAKPNYLPLIAVAIAAVAIIAVVFMGTKPFLQPDPGLDANGCQKNQGYLWCAAKKQCMRASEWNCTAPKASANPSLVNITIGNTTMLVDMASIGNASFGNLGNISANQSGNQTRNPALDAQIINASEFDGLCVELNGTIANAGGCPEGSLIAPAPLSAGKGKVCCYQKSS